MPAGHGLRARTRDSFSRGFRQKGYIPLSTYLTTYKLGDYVDIKVNSAVQKVSSQQPGRPTCGACNVELPCVTPRRRLALLSKNCPRQWVP